MKLYDMQSAPNPRRVRIFLAEKELQVEKVEINLVEGENLSEDFLNISPRGLLPTMEFDDGTILDESVAICRYIEALYPQPNLLGTDGKSRALIERWQRHMEFDGLIPLAEYFRNSFPAFAERAIPGLPAGYKAIPALAERGRQRYQLFLEGLNERLANSEYIAGEQFSIADITVLCTVDFARVVKVRIPQEHQHSQRWYQQVSARPSAKA